MLNSILVRPFRGFVLGALLCGCFGTTICVAGPITIQPGYDLTVTRTAYLEHEASMIRFVGAPLTTYDFADGNGSQFVHVTDTILKRSDGGVVSSSGNSITTSLEAVAISLRSATPIDIGFGSHYYYTSLVAGSSSGTMTIVFNGDDGGTWTNNFLFTVQLHRDSPTGVVEGPTISKEFNGFGEWRTTPLNAVVPVVIPHVNDDSFFLDGPAYHDDGQGTVHIVDDVNTVPEPGSIVLLSTAFLCGVFRWRRSLLRCLQK